MVCLSNPITSDRYYQRQRFISLFMVDGYYHL